MSERPVGYREWGKKRHAVSIFTIPILKRFPHQIIIPYFDLVAKQLPKALEASTSTMLAEIFVVVMLTGEITSQHLQPTDQTSFSYPDDGAGIPLPFPPDIANLTGLSNWPPLWQVPPFTPNMAAAYNSSATAINPDIAVPPNAARILLYKSHI